MRLERTDTNDYVTEFKGSTLESLVRGEGTLTFKENFVFIDLVKFS